MAAAEMLIVSQTGKTLPLTFPLSTVRPEQIIGCNRRIYEDLQAFHTPHPLSRPLIGTSRVEGLEAREATVSIHSIIVAPT